VLLWGQERGKINKQKKKLKKGRKIKKMPFEIKILNDFSLLQNIRFNI